MECIDVTLLKIEDQFPVETGLDWTILSRYTVPTVQTAQSTHTSNNYLDHSRTIKNSNV